LQHDDFRINATVRTLLVRLWIDLTQLDHGTMNGVVYLRGRLRKEMIREDSRNPSEESARLLMMRLERQIKGVRGVRDVVATLENVSKVKGQWVARKAS
jgi:hypothetical protein